MPLIQMFQDMGYTQPNPTHSQRIRMFTCYLYVYRIYDSFAQLYFVLLHTIMFIITLCGVRY